MTEEITEFETKLNPLPPETTAAQRAARKARKLFAAASSAFVRIMQECTLAYLEARRQGMEREDAIKGIEHTLRDVWPKPPTKFPPQCDLCADTGYEEFLCRPYARCERERCNEKGEEWQHTYVRPCECPKGLRFSGRAHVTDEAIAAVGKVVKPKRGFRQIGS